MPNITTNHAITFTNFELTYRENNGYEKLFLGGGGVNSQWETHGSVVTTAVYSAKIR